MNTNDGKKNHTSTHTEKIYYLLKMEKESSWTQISLHAERQWKVNAKFEVKDCDWRYLNQLNHPSSTSTSQIIWQAKTHSVCHPHTNSGNIAYEYEIE